MSKLICIYDESGTLKANKKCDVCGVLLCKFCGYSRGAYDFCNTCWDSYGQRWHEEQKKTEEKGFGKDMIYTIEKKGGEK